MRILNKGGANSNLDRNTAYPHLILRGLPQSLQANANMLPRLRYGQSFPIVTVHHHSPATLP
jgi:hypothetical protein